MFEWNVMCLVLCLSPSALANGAELGIDGARFTLNGRPTFLLGISYYGALGAPSEYIDRDLDDMQRFGFNWIRVWATWDFFDNDVSAVDETGKPREPFMTRLQWLVAECDKRGMAVDVTLMRSKGGHGAGRLFEGAAHRRAVESLVTALKPWRNWFLDLANERGVRDDRFVSIEELKQLRETVKRVDPRRLVTASDGDLGQTELRQQLKDAAVDFISPHRARHPGSPKETEHQSRKYLSQMNELGRIVPILYQEPFRRGYAPQEWEPAADEFTTDLKGALAGGAAGWCFHNGDQKDKAGGKPRRSFDLRQQRLFEQLDEHERTFLKSIPQAMSRRFARRPAVAHPDRAPMENVSHSDVAPQTGRLRVIVETDAGGDPDDEQSLVRFLLYANEWDVEGIIANRPKARDGENLNPERTGLGIVRRLIKAYGDCYPNLVKHDARYPRPDDLLRLTVSGYADSDAGVNLVLATVDSDDSRPVWFMNWGTDHGSDPSNLKRALDRVLAERGPAGYAEFKKRLRLCGRRPVRPPHDAG